MKRTRTITAALATRWQRSARVRPYRQRQRAVLDRCEQAAMAIVEVHDYRGTDLERSCFGTEDDPRVDAILSASESTARVLR